MFVTAARCSGPLPPTCRDSREPGGALFEGRPRRCHPCHRRWHRAHAVARDFRGAGGALAHSCHLSSASFSCSQRCPLARRAASATPAFRRTRARRRPTRCARATPPRVFAAAKPTSRHARSSAAHGCASSITGISRAIPEDRARMPIVRVDAMDAAIPRRDASAPMGSRASTDSHPVSKAMSPGRTACVADDGRIPALSR